MFYVRLVSLCSLPAALRRPQNNPVLFCSSMSHLSDHGFPKFPGWFPVQYACGASQTSKVADPGLCEHVISEKAPISLSFRLFPFCSMPAALRRRQNKHVPRILKHVISEKSLVSVVLAWFPCSACLRRFANFRKNKSCDC